MPEIFDAECEAVNVDPKAIAKIAKRLERAALDARKLGLMVFGGTGHGTIRPIQTSVGQGQLILARMEGCWDGGDGGHRHGDDGLMRGEW